MVGFIKKLILENRAQDLYYFWTLSKELSGVKSVLDVGCGYDSPLAKLRKTFTSEGIDIFRKNIILSRKYHMHDKHKVGDIRKLSRIFKPKSFDAVIALDVIEHVTKKEAIKLIKSCERIAIKKVILVTPNGFYEQGELFNNPYQAHHSGWNQEDLKKLGYQVNGLRGFKYLWGKNADIKYKPWLFWGFVTFASQFIFYYFPSWSFDLLAVKNINNTK